MSFRIELAACLILLGLASGSFAQGPDQSGNLIQCDDQGELPSLQPSYLSDVGGESLALHGYMETQVKTVHITPRGLIIADHGVEIQPAAGLTFNLYEGDGPIRKASATFGIWNSVNTSVDIPNAGPWFEIDYFARLNLSLANHLNLAFGYVAFDSPGAQFSTDNNIETTIAYDDTGWLAPDLGLRPYARLFYNASGSSTVVTGRNGNTYDIELGATPTFVWRQIDDYPVTFSAPTYLTVGPHNFWGGSQYVGIFTTSVAASVPLNFIPHRFGNWHADASVAYFNLLNGKLVDAAAILGNSRERNLVVGEFGVGIDF